MKAIKFTLGAFVLALLSLTGWANDKMNANIHIYETVQVGSSQLVPGEYKMTWTENGSNAEVMFSHGKNVIATVPAQVTKERSGYENPALFTDRVSNTLTGVALPNLTFSFAGGDAVAGK